MKLPIQRYRRDIGVGAIHVDSAPGVYGGRKVTSSLPTSASVANGRPAALNADAGGGSRSGALDPSERADALREP